MTRLFAFTLLGCVVLACRVAEADIVTDWNNTLCVASQTVVAKHNPGVPTRAMAMMNGSIYDVFQAVNRTHQPFKVDTSAPSASLDAAVSQAAYRVLSDMYPEVQSMLDSTLGTRLAAVPNGAAKTAGIDLGNFVAQQYITSHQNDGWSLPDAYTPTVGVGHWSADPMLMAQNPSIVQKGWGSDWGSVTPWAITSANQFDALTPFKISDMNTQRYTDAFNEAKAYGSRNSVVRTTTQTATGLFWAYDRPGTGAPPIMFIENMTDIASQIGNTPADNARMFAMASVSLADSIIAAWDQKYEVDLWRPITAIRNAANDGNPDTVADENWEYLGAPGNDPSSATDDFTPPFPAYISGHATMGGAIFKSLELFYGTNNFAAADAAFGNDAVTGQYTLHSAEPGSGFVRDYYVRFTQDGPIGPGLENSPEGENSMSRIYLGVHWRMDQEDGQALGRAVAQYVSANFFQPIIVPEPAFVTLIILALSSLFTIRRRGTT